MPCLIVLLALIVPRLTLILIWLFSNYLSRAYDSLVWPLLGFIFMPLTTLAYAYAINRNGAVSGVYFVLTLLAALVDLGAIGGGAAGRRRR
ncbi:MAG: hypothetical protein WBD40_15075 [Tepidisphaeraceae bacterium]